jgi:hypothetical protein
MVAFELTENTSSVLEAPPTIMRGLDSWVKTRSVSYCCTARLSFRTLRRHFPPKINWLPGLVSQSALLWDRVGFTFRRAVNGQTKIVLNTSVKCGQASPCIFELR